MPRRTYRKRPKFAKRTFRKKKFARRPYTTVNRSIGPVAPRLITKMKWNLSFTSVGSTIDQYINLNSLYQPAGNVGVVSHQPYGYDQITPLYNRYRVFAVSYILTATALDGNQNTIAVVADNTNAVYTNVQLFGESPRSIIKQVNGNGTQQMIKGRISLPRLNGVTSAQYKSDDRFQSGVTQSPTEIMCLHIGNWGSLSAGATDTTLFNLTVKYHCEFFDPNRLPSS